MITATPTELTKTLQAYEEAAARNDVDGISKFLDESFVQTYPTGKVANKQEHLRALRSMNAKVEARDGPIRACYAIRGLLFFSSEHVLWFL